MKALVLASTVLVFSPAFGQRDDAGVFHYPITVPSFRREFRGVWVATVSNIDWPSTKGTSSSAITAQKNEAQALLTMATDLKLNAIFLQVRPQCDALYKSLLEPWSNYLTNSMGVAPTDSTWDPLAYWVTECHKRGIELHAWFNPYRALASTSTTASSNHISVTNPGIVRTYGTAKWLDPGDPQSATHTLNVISDVVTRYDIDGVVFDDYFYPYPISGQAFPDSATYATYGGGLSLANWRRKNVDDFVSNLSTQIHSIKSYVKFGIGPFGIWKPGNPAGITGLSAYDELYADSRKWLQMGWVDYLAPQLYWKISSTGQPYDDLLAWWSNSTQNPMGRQVFASNATYQCQTTGGNWPASEIQNQVAVTRTTAGATGNVHYNASSLRLNYNGVKTALQNNEYAAPALVPVATWLDNIPPVSPAITYKVNKATANHEITWTAQGTEAARLYAVTYLRGTTWTQTLLASTTTSLTLPVKSASGPLRAFGIAAVDRLGNASPWVTGVLDPTVIGSTIIRDSWITRGSAAAIP